MVELINCPHCGTPNEEQNVFCLNCGRPLKGESTLVLTGEQDHSAALKGDDAHQKQNETAQLPKKSSFIRRPEKAIFGDRFLGIKHLQSDQSKHIYLVTEIVGDEGQAIKQCTNPECGAVHAPFNNTSEIFCTACGSALSNRIDDLILLEASKPIFGNSPKLLKMNLVHPGIRVPVAAFNEKLCGNVRFCLVRPSADPIPGTIDTNQIHRWAAILASAFEYLHQSGLTYNGQFDQEIFQQTNDHIVIANFENIRHKKQVDEEEKIADFQALSKAIFSWSTGLERYDHDVGLAPELDKFFDIAINTPNISTAKSFIKAFSEAQELGRDTTPQEHRLGRLTDVGMVRNLNEDSLLTIKIDKYLVSQPHPLGIYVVADGMGGHSAGEVASGIIVNTIAEIVFTNGISNVDFGQPEECFQWVNRIIQGANKAVFDMGQKTNSDMGSTLLMALVIGNSVYLGHVGDSRAYHINQEGIKQLTKDHSLVERLIENGQISREEARNHPQRNVIYRTIGDKEKVDVENLSCPMKRGDRLLLCSDGLSGMLKDEAIRKIVMEGGLSPQAACINLVEAAKQAGGEDNITVVILEFS